MKEIIWVYGPSGVGKEHFIDNFYSDEEDKKKLNWQNKKISICKSSIKFNGTYHGDPIDLKRVEIINEVKELSKTSDVILIKWQFVDSENDRLMELKSLLPDFTHKIIVLSAPIEVLVARLKTKSWWHSDGDEVEHINNSLEKINNDPNLNSGKFEIVRIESDPDYNYKLL